VTSEHLDALWTDFLEGDLPVDALGELDACLRGDAAFLDRAVASYALHRLLGLVHQAGAADRFIDSTLDRLHADRESFVGAVRGRLGAPPLVPAAPLTPTAPQRRWRAALAIAAAAGLIAAIVVARSAGPGAAVSDRTSPVATFLTGDRARWQPDVAILPGQRLASGPLRLGSGTAIVQFDGGAVVAVHAPADLVVESRGALRLLHGRVGVRASGDAAGFTVRLPAGEARDLGTEFTARAELSGASEVHVIDGEVAWARGAQQPPLRVLRAGEAVRFESPDDPAGRPIAILAQTVDEVLRQIATLSLRAQPSAYEGFAYPAGDLPVAQADGGFGWLGPWRLRQGGEMTRETDATSALSILGASLDGDWRLPPASVGALLLPAGQSFRLRQLAQPVDLGADSVVYVSFRLRRDAAAPPAGGQPAFRLTFRSAADYWGPSLSIALAPSRRPSLQVRNSDSYIGTTTVAGGATTLWVAKILGGRRLPNEAFLLVLAPDQALPLYEPAAWTVASGPFQAQARLDLAVLTGSGPLAHTIDELRIGPTWDAVTAVMAVMKVE